MNTNEFIGVVGGMGPLTGVDLVNKIHQESLAVKDQDHLPIVLASYPDRIPDRGAFVLGRSTENPAEPIAEVLKFLDHSGAAVAGIPCVTAHCDSIMSAVMRKIRGEVRMKLLNLLDETVRFISQAAPGIRRVGALSTTASYQQQVFRPALENAGFEVVLQDPSIQDDLVHPAIFDAELGIKSSAGPVSEFARMRVRGAIRHLGDRGAEAVILGCTELPLAVPDSWVDGVFAVDPTRALARGLVREFAIEKLKSIGKRITV